MGQVKEGAEYYSLYEMLDKCQYILANSLEQGLKDLENWPLIEAMGEYNREYYGAMSDEELKDYGWDGQQDKDEFIADRDYPEIYTTYVIDEHTAEILKDYGEFVYHNEGIDLSFWGVMHWGTSWDYVMGDQYPVKNKEYYRKQY